MPDTCLCFISSAQYLPQARLAIESAHRHNPAFDILLLTDIVGYSDLILQHVNHLVRHDYLDLHSHPSWLIPAHARVLLHAFSLGYSHAIYLDSDTYTYGPFLEIIAELERHDLLLTPHTLTPYPDDGCRPNMFTLNESGNYSSGFLAATPGAIPFLRWWDQQSTKYYDWHLQRAHEQLWLRFAADFCPRAKVFRHPGYNLAYWNVGERVVERSNSPSQGPYTVDYLPLRMAHFSGFNALVAPEQMSVHQNRHTLASGSAACQIFASYKQAMGWV